MDGRRCDETMLMVEKMMDKWITSERANEIRRWKWEVRARALLCILIDWVDVVGWI